MKMDILKSILGIAGMATMANAFAQPPLPTKPYELNVLLIDLSGSMASKSNTDPKKTRLQLGMDAVRTDINTQRIGRHSAIYTFNSTDGLKKIIGFDSPKTEDTNHILSLLTNIEKDPKATKGATPFAQAYCDIVDTLKNEASKRKWAPIEVDLKITLATDGLENSTIKAHKCYGTNGLSKNKDKPWTVVGSWQYKVKNMGETGNPASPGNPNAPSTIITNVNYLFDSFVRSSSQRAFASLRKSNEEINFYEAQTSGSGGYIRTISNSGDLPVAGDVNGDFCVNNDDYQIILDNYGKSGKFNIPGDLNNDRTVNYDDYGTLLQFWGKGHGC